MPSSFETIAFTARWSLSPAERNFDASRSICESSVMSTTSFALSASPGMSMVSLCACRGAVMARIRSAKSVLRMSASFRKFVDVLTGVVQFLTGDAEREEDLLLRALPFAPLLDIARRRPADDQREQRSRGERAPYFSRTLFRRREDAVAKSRRRFLPPQCELQFFVEVHRSSSIRRSERSARWRWLLTVFSRMPATRLISSGPSPSW